MARRMTLTALAFLLGALGLIATADPAAACSCTGAPLSEYSDEITIAFTGRQISRVVHSQTADLGTTLLFEVDEVFEGQVDSYTKVSTSAQSSACGVDYSDADVVYIAASTWRGRLSVGLCSSHFTASDFEEEFGASYAPIPVSKPSLRSSTSKSTPIAILAIAIAGGAAVLAYRGSARRRRNL